MAKRDPFSHKMRDSSAYRADRLQVEHERLMRRLKWAMARNDEAVIEWLESRLDALEQDMDADLGPGKMRGRFG
ncbi:hypothetical protein HNO51_12455 [Billgrantia sulfidoxydans]|uniref:Uncharacterized protein n=1 Tax=Billgrantia sulfidoxydans TaxID=2733484 RepID=A0ABX7W5I1_9GAMM|nr:hypothetical protein [Halomonas sulfidoxydans]QTP55420.1 hypothetical protein HNO51_12455 [Halomonas sulfidoxydans]